MVALVKLVARTLPNSIDWEIGNERLENPCTHAGRWRCDLKPIGRIDENMMARLNRGVLEALGLNAEEPENGLDAVDRKEQN